jgi:hypothetical protein
MKENPRAAFFLSAQENPEVGIAPLLYLRHHSLCLKNKRKDKNI